MMQWYAWHCVSFDINHVKFSVFCDHAHTIYQIIQPTPPPHLTDPRTPALASAEIWSAICRHLIFRMGAFLLNNGRLFFWCSNLKKWTTFINKSCVGIQHSRNWLFLRPFLKICRQTFRIVQNAFWTSTIDRWFDVKNRSHAKAGVHGLLKFGAGEWIV